MTDPDGNWPMKADDNPYHRPFPDARGGGRDSRGYPTDPLAPGRAPAAAGTTGEGGASGTMAVTGGSGGSGGSGGPGGSAPAGGAPAGDPGWERRLIEELARDALVERRRTRRWQLVNRLLGLALVVAGGLLAWSWFQGGLEPSAGLHSALIDVQGVIDADGRVEASSVVSALQSAFEDKNTAGVILRINSPGGSPVQAGIIHDEIRRLRQLNPTVPLHAVVEDICASGGYYLAAAADRIYVNKASLIGSIGVVISGFGFTGLIDKAGVERRLLIAGENKGFLDSFSPVSPEQKTHAQAMIDEIHRQFITVVREGRGSRLRESPELFSGLVWTGERSIELGLADEYGTIDSVARDVIKAADIVDFSYRDSLIERLSRRLGAAAGEVIASRLGSSEGGWRLR